MLDAAAYCLGFSPNFSQDATVFAGTDTTVYFSYNGALAWKQLDFPESAAPALSLAVSPNFGQDQTLFVGTETQGLYRSADRGRTWRRLDLPAECVNALAISAPGQPLLAGTEAGMFASSDQGETWSRLLDLPSVISLASAGELTVAGVVDQGVRLVTHPAERQPLPSLSARAVLGLALSPQFEQQPVAFMYGPQEGLWRTADGGRTWDDLGDELPSPDISALVLAPDFSTNPVAVAARPQVSWSRPDAGQHWVPASEEPAGLVAFSPNGHVLAAAFGAGMIRETGDLGKNWLPVPGPGRPAAESSPLRWDDSHHFYIAVLEGLGRTLSLWHKAKSNDFPTSAQPAGRRKSGRRSFHPGRPRGRSPLVRRLRESGREVQHAQAQHAAQSYRIPGRRARRKPTVLDRRPERNRPDPAGRHKPTRVQIGGRQALAKSPRLW